MNTDWPLHVLAYPEIRPPYKLLAKGLLYADRFGSISPALYDGGLSYAFDEGFYEPVMPFGVLDGNLAYLQMVIDLSERFAHANPDEWSDTLQESTLLSDKFPSDVLRALRESKVVTPVGEKRLLGAPEFVLAAMSLTAHVAAEVDGWVCETTRKDVYATTWLDAEPKGTEDVHGQRIFRLQRTNYPIPTPRTTEKLVQLRKREGGLLNEIRHVVDQLNSADLAWDFRKARETDLQRLTTALGKAAGDHENALGATGVTNLLITVAGGLAAPAVVEAWGGAASVVAVGLGSIGVALEIQRRKQNRDAVTVLTSVLT